MDSDKTSHSLNTKQQMSLPPIFGSHISSQFKENPVNHVDQYCSGNTSGKGGGTEDVKQSRYPFLKKVSQY